MLLSNKSRDYYSVYVSIKEVNNISKHLQLKGYRERDNHVNKTYVDKKRQHDFYISRFDDLLFTSGSAFTLSAGLFKNTSEQRGDVPL